MRLTDKLVEKFGADKLLHFFVSAWLVAECKEFGIAAGFFGWIAVIVLSVLKEFMLDEEWDSMDVVAGAYGGFLSLAIGVLLDCLTNNFAL